MAEGMKLLMSKDLQFYCSVSEWDIVAWMVLVRTIYQRVKSEEQFGSSTARILLRYVEKSHKVCLCVCSFPAVLQYFLFLHLQTLFIEFKLDYLSGTWFYFMHMYNLKFILLFHLTIHSCCLNLCFVMTYKKGADVVSLKTAWHFCPLLALWVINSLVNFILEHTFISINSLFTFEIVLLSPPHF